MQPRFTILQTATIFAIGFFCGIIADLVFIRPAVDDWARSAYAQPAPTSFVVVNPPPCTPYEQYDPVTGRIDRIPGWLWEIRDDQGNLIGTSCTYPGNNATPIPNTPIVPVTPSPTPVLTPRAVLIPVCRVCDMRQR